MKWRIGAHANCFAVVQKLEQTNPTVASKGLELRIEEHLMNGLAGIVDTIEPADAVAAEVAVENHFEIRVRLDEILPELLTGRIAGHTRRSAARIVGL